MHLSVRLAPIQRSSLPFLSNGSPMETPGVLSYASPNMAKPRISFRGAVTQLIVGGALFLLTIIFVAMAWSIFRHEAELTFRRSSLDPLGCFVCVLAGLSFLMGMIILLMGLRGVRQREMV